MSNNQETRYMIRDREEWCRWDGDTLLVKAEFIRDFHKSCGRLPVPVAERVREAHRLLGQVIEKLDEKKEIAA